MSPLVTNNIAKFSQGFPVWITPLFVSSINTLISLEEDKSFAGLVCGYGLAVQEDYPDSFAEGYP